MPIQIQEINDETVECPLCMEPFEADDINFFPCVCGYQVCRFCWHRIRTDENGLCPACRTSYPENPVEFRPLTESDLQKIRHEKRQKESQRRQKISDCRRHLAAIRVLQKNLVFVVGISQRLSDAEILKRQDYFGKYGKIIKIVINTNTAYAGSQGPSASAYITYSKMEEALRAIQSVNNIHVDGRTLKASLGTTKYCSTYLKNQVCHKQDCMYLHELADEASSFTKEDMQAGKHQELEQRLIEEVTRRELEAAAHAETTSASTETITNPSTKSERLSSSTRANVSYSWSVQQNTKTDTWPTVSGSTSHNGDQATANDKSSEAKTKDIRNSPKVKAKKLSPRHHSKASTPTIDTLTSDSSVVSSSESSSVPTTPPPNQINLINQDTRLNENIEKNVVQEDNLSTNEQIEQIAKAATEMPTSTTIKNTPVTATTPTPTTATEDETQDHETVQRYIQPNENNQAVDANFHTTNLLPPPYRASSITNVTLSSPLPDVIPIQSSNDWEAAFGFTKENDNKEVLADSGDNDFGFDPWLECSKGLADLMEKESAYNNLRQSEPNKIPYSHPLPLQHPDTHNFPSRQENTVPHFGIKSSSAFSNNFTQHPSHSAFNLHSHNLYNTNSSFDSVAKPNFSQSPTKKLSDWENGLRALLPNVNINFAMEGQASNSNAHLSQGMRHNNSMPVLRRQSPRSHGFATGPSMLGTGLNESSNPIHSHSFFSSNFDSNRSFFPNGMGQLGTGLTNERYNNVAPPPGLSASGFPSDPAIISSGNPAPPKQTPAQEETPHWMRSLQALVETEAPINPQSSFPVSSQPNPTPFSSWPSLPNAGTPGLGAVSHPPPGFQNRLSYNNTSDFTMRQSLLENQS